ncbi:MAG: hypothetical protein HUK22_07225 [Thermoguttaceae bacterium]|nr:hypothetical protein [Thermoguttaceae bacterium]
MSQFPHYALLNDVKSDPWETASAAVLELRLTNLLTRRQILEFSRRLDECAARLTDAGARPLPKHFQEARLLGETLGAARLGDARAISPDCARAFDEFKKFKASADFHSDAGRAALFAAFGSTYWAFYYDDTTVFADVY